MGQKIKLRKQMKDILHDKYQQGYGTSKHDKKDEHNSTPLIHSRKTYETYRSQVDHFADYCLDEGIETLDDAYAHVGDYARRLEQDGKSAWTIQTSLCAIAKVYGCSTKDFDYDAPTRERVAVTRSRYTAERDKHFSWSSEANRELVTFCRSTGLRRSELEALHGCDIVEGDNGESYIHVVSGKGGRERYALVIGSDEDKKVVKDAMDRAGDGKVFEHVHSKLDVHHERANYACSLYREIARDVDELPQKDKYICRKDRAGVTYDREAMKVVSQNLGHNRIDVIAESYLYNL